MTRPPPLLRALPLLVLASGACRNAPGEPCRQARDCRDGLVCVVGTEIVPEDAPPTSEIGECVENDEMIDDETSVSPPEDLDDMHTRRDLGAGDTGDTGDTGTTSG